MVVYGWFGRLRGWTPRHSWQGVVVRVDGEQRVVLTQLKRGPFWIDVRPGSHRLEFVTSGRSLRSEELTVGEGQVVLAAFRPPNRRRSEEWCSRPL